MSISLQNVLEAAGDFRTSCDAIQFSEREHPVNLWANAGVPNRQTALSHPHVIGIAFVDKEHNLQLLYAHYLSASETEELILYGHLGENTTAHNTVMIRSTEDDQDFLADVVVPIPCEMILGKKVTVLSSWDQRCHLKVCLMGMLS